MTERAAISQISFSDAEYAGKRKKTRREVFLDEMEVVVPWKALLGLIDLAEDIFTSVNKHLQRKGIAKLPEGRRKAAAQKREHRKASVRAKVEHPFRVIKRQFGLTKVRVRGLTKNTAHVVTLFALSNLWMVRRQLMAMAAIRPRSA